jgi:hypothetical protein
MEGEGKGKGEGKERKGQGQSEGKEEEEEGEVPVLGTSAPLPLIFWLRPWVLAWRSLQMTLMMVRLPVPEYLANLLLPES